MQSRCQQLYRALRGAAQVSLALQNPEAILGHHLLAFSLLTLFKMSSLAACRGHPKPGSEETSLAFPVLFSECPACFFVYLFLFCFVILIAGSCFYFEEL